MTRTGWLRLAFGRKSFAAVLILAALAGCTTLTLQFMASRHGWRRYSEIATDRRSGAQVITDPIITADGGAVLVAPTTVSAQSGVSTGKTRLRERGDSDSRRKGEHEKLGIGGREREVTAMPNRIAFSDVPKVDRRFRGQRTGRCV